MKRTLTIILIGIILVVATIFTIRFLFGGNEDTWICNNGEWVKHGNPLISKPAEKCGENQETITPKQEYMTVKVFFGNSKKNPEVSDCKLVFPVERKILKTEAVARATIIELLNGPTETEKDDGYYTSINNGTKLQSIILDNDNTVRVDFNKNLDFPGGGSCWVESINSQITETLKQFSTVKKVVISIDGETEGILQP